MKASHFGVVALCSAGLMAGARVGLNAQGAVPSGNTRSAATPALTRDGTDEKAKLRLREGTSLTDQGGHFRPDGDGAVFIAESGYELVALPNLNLERVVRTLKGSDVSESIRWSVNGIVTEFNGRNYLLLQRAVYKSASPPPTPEQILN
jgi:hypothetical protein